MKCIIIDDEHLACKGIELLIEQVPFLQHCNSFSNAMDADSYLKANHVDLIFLDIQMPVMTGLDYIRSTIEPSCQFILTTAYSKYALEGFDLNVTDYLVKPIRFERFYKAIQKALSKYNQLKVTDTGNNLLQADDHHVFIRADRKFIRVNLRDLSFVEGSKDYVTLHTPEKIMVAMNLRNITTHLPPTLFMRISKSFIINLEKITYIDNDYVQIGKQQIPIGSGYKKELLEYVRNKGLIGRK
jgi:two-component system LytT family response regulator